MIRLTTILKRYDQQGEKTGWTYIEIPAVIAQKLKPANKKEFKVRGKLDNYALERISVMPVGEGNFIMAVNSEIRKAIKKSKGDSVKLAIEEDTSEFSDIAVK